MVTRTRKQTIVDTPFVETESAAPVIDWAFIKGEATWKRWACAMVAGIAASFATSYVGGYLVAALTLSMAMLTGSMFLTWLIYVIGILIVMYVSYRSSMFVYMGVIDRSVDETCMRSWKWATGLFATETEKVTA